MDRAVIEHLVDLLAERGPDGFSVDELAACSGVGKAAIYRRYRSRDELIEAGFASINESMPDVSRMPVREALVTLLQWVSGAHAGGMTPTWLLGMQHNPQIKDLYMSRVVQPRREAIRSVLRRGCAEGLLDPDLDLEVALTCLSAPAVVLGMHRARGYRSGATIAGVVDMALAGMLKGAPASDS